MDAPYLFCLCRDLCFYNGQINSNDLGWPPYWDFIVSIPMPSTLTIRQSTNNLFVCCLFGLMLYVPVNSNGDIGTLPPFHGTFIYVTTRLMYEPLFLSRLRHTCMRLTSNQMVGHSQ